MGLVLCCFNSTADDRLANNGVEYVPLELQRTNTIVSITPGKFVLEKPDTLINEYAIQQVLGRGAYGIVYKTIHKKSGEIRAIKKIKKSRKEVDGKLLEEISILKQLDHPNIMKIYEFTSNEKEHYIVSEYIPGGELFDMVSMHKRFTEVDAAFVMRQLLAAISYCHSRNIVHRDLKLENILIDTIKDKKPIVKIIDFGTALITQPKERLSKKVGSIYYIAPETLRGDYTLKCDIWSLGVIMYILLSGTAPFNASNNKKIMEAILKGDFDFPKPLWDNISDEAKDLINKMLTYDPRKRITAIEAYKHPWLQICAPIKLDPSHARAALENIRSFNAKEKLQKAALMLIVSQFMSKQERDKLKDIFLALDKNANGKITYQELIQGYSMTTGDNTFIKEEIDEASKGFSIDKNKEINYSDFLLAAANKNNLVTLKNIKKAFDVFDLSNSGYILPSEIKTILGPGKKLDEKIWNEIVAEADLTGDGRVSYHEFEYLMKKYLR